MYITLTLLLFAAPAPFPKSGKFHPIIGTWVIGIYPDAPTYSFNRDNTGVMTQEKDSLYDKFVWCRVSSHSIKLYFPHEMGFRSYYYILQWKSGFTKPHWYTYRKGEYWSGSRTRMRRVK